MRLLPITGIAVFVLAAASCGDSTDPTPVELSLASVLADASMGTHASSAASSVATSAPVASFSASGCPYVAATQRFVCPVITANNLTVNVYYQLLDASGGTQAAFGPTTTASLRVVRDVAGTTTLNGVSAAITEHHESVLSGLQTQTRVLNGTGTGSAVTSLATIGMTQTITNVTFPPRSSVTRYPTSGTIATHVNYPIVTDTDVTITFNGTALASVVITGTGAATCTLNLANPAAGMSCA